MDEDTLPKIGVRTVHYPKQRNAVEACSLTETGEGPCWAPQGFRNLDFSCFSLFHLGKCVLMTPHPRI